MDDALASPRQIDVMGMPIAVTTEAELLNRVDVALDQGRGGWIVTANLDVVMHFANDAAAREAYLAADLRIADGMPLVWASRLDGDPLPERVAGSTLAVSLLTLAAHKGASVVFLGGAPGTAEAAAKRARERLPKLSIHADSTLVFDRPPSEAQIRAAVDATKGARIVLVGLGSPKQELLIQEMRPHLPNSWFVGVGGTFGFLSGAVRRAPRLMQGLGLEWAHRFALDPVRLGPRYARNIGFVLDWAIRRAVPGARGATR